MMNIEQAMNPTIEEAIQRLEGMVFTSDLSPNALRAIAVNKMALAALREKAERQKGCEYCQNALPEDVTPHIERAIKHFASLQKRYTTQHNGEQCALVETAIDALREKLERSKGCVWCNENNKVFHDGQHFHFFCSYCGKRLEVNHEAD